MSTETNPNQAKAKAKPKVLEGDDKFDYLAKKAKRKYKNKKRFYQREAENAATELNLVAMMDMMTILLVFLIKSYAAVDISVAMGDDLMPPSSNSTISPVKTITVTITKKDIAVQEKGVARFEGEGKLPSSDYDGQIIAPLKDALDMQVMEAGKIVDYNPAVRARVEKDPTSDPRKMLTIVGDKDMPYNILYQVLGTAGQAGLKYFKFLVISNS